MEDHSTPVPPAEPALSLADVERQLTALSQQVSAEISALAQMDTARREALDTRESELRRRELNARAHELLKDRGLPTALSTVLSFSNESALNAGIDALEKAFRAAVQSGVEERLLTAAPKAPTHVAPSDLSDEEYYAVVCRSEY